MPVDTSMYPTAASQPVIPGGINGVVTLSNALTQNRMLNADLASRQAIGNAFTNALNPDGTVDFNILSSGLQSPDTAYGAPAAIDNMASLRSNAISNQGAQLNQSTQRINGFFNSVGPFLSQPGGPKYGDVMGRAYEMLHAGQLTQDDVNNLQSTMPTNSKQLASWAKTRFDSTLGPSQISPTPTGVSSVGAPQTGTLSSFADKAADAAAAGQSGIPLSVSPGVGQTLAAAGKQYQDLGQAQSTYAQQNGQMQTALQQMQKTNFGPGTEARNKIQSFMLALPGGIGNWIPGVDADSVKAYDEANKYVTAQAAGSPSALRSDSALNTALASNPSLHISAPAAIDIQKANIGYRRSEMAAYQIFNKIPGADPSDFTKWYANYNNNIDPRAFTADMQTPAQRSSYYSGLSDASSAGQPSARQRYRDTLKLAIAAGQIHPADMTAPQGGGSSGQ